MNLYLYIPPASAHPAGCIKGTVYGLIRRYHATNTNKSDYIYFVRLLYRRLLRRGWEKTFLRKLIIEACTYIENKPTIPTAPTNVDDTNNRIFIHLKYHPDDIPRQKIQELYKQYCGDIFRTELDIDRPTIAYSRPKNLGDFITKAKLHQAPGLTSSIIMGEYKAGLDPA